MANPTELLSGVAVITATSSAATLTLDAARRYAVMHDGESSGGVDSDNTVYMLTAATGTPDDSEGANKLKLPDRRALTVGPGVSALRFLAASDTTFTIAALPINADK
jgi:hypothetical protein